MSFKVKGQYWASLPEEEGVSIAHPVIIKSSRGPLILMYDHIDIDENNCAVVTQRPVKASDLPTYKGE